MYLNRGLGQVSVFAGEGLESSETVPTTFAPAYCSSGMPDEGTSTCAPYAVFPTIAAAQGSQAMPAKVQSAMAAIQNAPCLSSLGSPDSNPGTPTPDEILQLAQQQVSAYIAEYGANQSNIETFGPSTDCLDDTIIPAARVVDQWNASQGVATYYTAQALIQLAIWETFSYLIGPALVQNETAAQQQSGGVGTQTQAAGAPDEAAALYTFGTPLQNLFSVSAQEAPASSTPAQSSAQPSTSAPMSLSVPGFVSQAEADVQSGFNQIQTASGFPSWALIAAGVAAVLLFL